MVGSTHRQQSCFYTLRGRSEPAPHFYLELLRQRLVNPVLEVKSMKVVPAQVARTETSIFLATQLHFAIENVGRVAAYKWQMRIEEIDGHLTERLADYVFGQNNYPPGIARMGGIRLDETILPGSRIDEQIHLGFHLRPEGEQPEQISREIELMLSPAKLGYKIATETSPGELRYAKLADAIDVDKLAGFICAQLNAEAAP